MSNARNTFNTRPVLDRVTDVLTLAVMAGLTVASAATYAFSPAHEPTAEPVRLPTVVVVGKKAPPHEVLPTVVVTGRRA